MKTTRNGKPTLLNFSEWRKTVGRFHATIELANYGDLELARRGDLASKEVRRTTVRGVVDSGASELVLPEAVAKHLGIHSEGKVKVRYADNREAVRDMVVGVHVRLQGRDGVFNAIVEPKRKTVLIGAFVLEHFDFLVDPKNERLVPRDPRYIISEIE